MTTVLRMAALIAAALLVVGVVWGVLAWQGDAWAGTEGGGPGRAAGEGRAAGLGSGFGRAGRDAGSASRTLEGSEGHDPGDGPGRGRGEADRTGATGLDELAHNLMVIGAIGAIVVAVTLAVDAFRRASARRRSTAGPGVAA